MAKEAERKERKSEDRSADQSDDAIADN